MSQLPPTQPDSGQRYLSDNDILLYYSEWVADGVNYLGGQRSTETLSDNYLHNLLGKTTDEEQLTGIQKFRCLYVFNNSETVYIKNPAIFVVSDTTSPNDYVEVGWGTAKIGTGKTVDADGSVEQAVLNENTEPEGVAFRKGNVRSSGAILNDDIPPKKGKACWVKYTSQFNAQDHPYNIFKLRLVADNIIPQIASRVTVNLPPQIIFNVFGNASSDTDFAKLSSMMLPLSAHFHVTTGNNNTDSNPGYFFSTMGIQNMAKTLLALGPKDVINPTVQNAYINEMAKYTFVSNPQRTYYSKTFHNVHVLVMNTSGSIPYTNPSPQYDFVVDDLRKANSNPAIEWIFVVTSRPVYGPPVMDNPNRYYNDIAQTYHQIFVDNGVLVVFQGQINAFIRMNVLKYNPSNPLAPQSLAYDGPDNYTINGKKNFEEGCIFILAGHGGDYHDNLDFSPNQGGVVLGSDTDFGFIRVVIENRLEVPKVTIRDYKTSKNVMVFSSQFSVTRTS